MLRIIFSLVFTVLLLLPLQGQQTNHAALIGVGAYPKSTGWSQLSSANDMELLSLTLQDVGFLSENIHTILDTQATKKGITDFLQQEVAPKLHKGDLLVLHFSGHGQQATDDNRDEDDGLDECWVPFDSPKEYQAGVYEGDNLLRDDEIGSILDDFLERVGPEGYIFLSVDACHSGTSTRGLGTARGTDVTMGKPASPRKGLFGQNEHDTPSKPDQFTAKARNNLVVFTSSSPTQLSYEQSYSREQFGAYTYELCRGLRAMEQSSTVLELYDEVKKRLQNLGLHQTPTAEGFLNNPMFGGRLTPPVPVFRIVEQQAPDTLRLDVGSLKGIYPGTIMALFPAGTADTTQVDPIARGIITSVTAVNSDLALTAPVSASAIENSRAYPIFTVPPPIDLSVHLRDLSPEVTANIQAILKDNPLIRISDLPASLIIEDNQDSIFIWTPDDRLIWSKPLANDTGGQIIGAIKQHVQATALRLIETKDPAYQATVQLLILTDNGWEVFQSDQVIQGSKMRFVVTNTGDIPFYYSLVDIQPDDQVFTLIPKLGEDERLSYLEPGEKDKTESFTIKPPFGPETIKLICTDQPVRLRIINTTRGGLPPKPHLLEVLYASSFPEIGGTRGISIEEKPAGAGSVHTLMFNIVKKEE